ncbi:MAG TPA: 4-(cytidine 5'-diphospho)-2-C-methyl-D-erythritol kinase [Gammaproteobacteria bacterium]|nr:4-(cytidine 5'-diphospho)-2-C-methyl-D-erythritol kinase [Gammaproteobacteria bacterium]
MSAASGRSWPAPAKINLFLHVVGRRDDGYHELQTAFQFLDRCDRLRFSLRDDDRICRRGGPPDLPPAQDLSVRAARLLQEASGCRAGADITVDKILPPGGGLGGGSSDAATTLVALNRLWRLGRSTSELAALGLRLGADVPVFVHGHAAWAEGVGERLTPIDPPEPWYVVLVPAVRVSTAAVFGAPELTRNSAPITIADLSGGRARNDCLPVVCGRYPAVSSAYDWLSGYGEARLTGTGGCVFAAFPDERAATAVHAKIPPTMEGFVARGRNRSPLLDRLAEPG